MDRNDLRSQSLDLLRFPLAIVVMTIHVWFPGVADATADVPALNALNGLVAGLLWDQSVPVYFFISGFVFFLNADMSAATYRRKLRNRTKSLLIPYIIWNTLAIAKLLLFALPCLGFLFADQRTLADMDLSAGAVAWSYWDISRGIMHTPLVTGEIYPIDTPLWFLRDLMIVVVTTPLLHLALRRARRVTMALLFAAWAASAFFPPGHHSQLLTAYFFFAWGAGISINGRDIFVEFGRKARVAAVAYVALSAAYAVAYCHCAEAMPLLKKANQCAGLITAYNAAAWLLQRGVCRVNRFLASASFFIYVGHMLVVHEVYMALVRLTHADPTGGLGSAAAHVLSIPVTTGLLLGVFYLLRRYTPRLLKVVAGRK